MKQAKRILSLALALVMVLGLLPGTAFAEGPDRDLILSTNGDPLPPIEVELGSGKFRTMTLPYETESYPISNITLPSGASWDNFITITAYKADGTGVTAQYSEYVDEDYPEGWYDEDFTEEVALDLAKYDYFVLKPGTMSSVTFTFTNPDNADYAGSEPYPFPLNVTEGNSVYTFHSKKDFEDYQNGFAMPESIENPINVSVFWFKENGGSEVISDKIVYDDAYGVYFEFPIDFPTDTAIFVHIHDWSCTAEKHSCLNHEGTAAVSPMTVCPYMEINSKGAEHDTGGKNGSCSVCGYAAAKIGEKLYASLEAAVEAAQDGDMIYLLDNVSFDNLTISKAITINKNGYGINGHIAPGTDYWFSENEETGVITITAIVTVPVTFVGNFEGSDYSKTVKQESKKNYILPEEPTRDKYDFVGWFTDPTGGEEVTDETIVTIEEEQTLYAHWLAPYKRSVGEGEEMQEVTFKPISSISALKKLFASGGNGYLVNDLAANAPLTVAEEKTVILCLNDKVLNLNQKGSITVGKEASFTLCDVDSASGTKRFYECGEDDLWTLAANQEESTPSFTVGGVITGGLGTEYGGCVKVDGGSFILYGGNICGNTVKATQETKEAEQPYARGGGVAVCKDGSFKMTGGTICGNLVVSFDSEGNVTNSRGGGVAVCDGGSFTMTGGEIRMNKSFVDVGAILVEGKATLTGGKIVGNKAAAGANNWGIFANFDGHTPDLTLGGTVEIDSESAVFGPAKLGTEANAPEEDMKVALASARVTGAQRIDTKYFFAADQNEFVVLDDDNALSLSDDIGLIKLNCGVNGKLEVSPEYAFFNADGRIAYNLNIEEQEASCYVTATPEEGYVLKSLTVDYGYGAENYESGTPFYNGNPCNVTFIAEFGEPAYAAKVGEIKCSTIEQAFAEAATMDEAAITLLDDVSVIQTLKIGKNVTLDLNGHTLTGCYAEEDCEAIFRVASGAAFKVVDGSGEQTGAVTAAEWNEGGITFFTLEDESAAVSIEAGTYTLGEDGVFTDVEDSVSIIGGTFDFDPIDYVAPGYEAIGNEEDGTYTVAEEKKYKVTWNIVPHTKVTVALTDGTPIDDSGSEFAPGKEIVFTVTPDEGYAYAEAPEGWDSGENGSITKTVKVGDDDIYVEIPTPSENSISVSWPEEWGTPDDETKAKFADWFTAYGKDADLDSKTAKQAFLLNTSPEEADAELGRFTITSFEKTETGEYTVTIPTENSKGEAFNGSCGLILSINEQSNKVDPDSFEIDPEKCPAQLIPYLFAEDASGDNEIFSAESGPVQIDSLKNLLSSFPTDSASAWKYEGKSVWLDGENLHFSDGSDAEWNIPSSSIVPKLNDQYELVTTDSEVTFVMEDDALTSIIVVWTEEEVFDGSYEMSATISVTFVGNFDGSVYSETVEQTPDEKYVLPETNPTRDGYTFAGWFDAAEEGSEITAETIFDSSVTTVYAHWNKAAAYLKITYQLPDGSEDYFEQSINYGETYSKESPAITGYTPNMKIVTGTMGNEDVIVNINYTINSHQLTIHYIEKDAQEDFDSVSETLDYGTEYQKESIEHDDMKPEIVLVSGIMPDEDVEIFVYYKLNAHLLKITYNYPDETSDEKSFYYTDGENYNIITPEVEGLIPDKDSVSGTMSSQDVSVTVTYTKAPINCIFDANYEGSVYSETIPQTPDETYELPKENPERGGYIFAGWFTDAAAGTEVTAVTTFTGDVTTVYAHWEIKKLSPVVVEEETDTSVEDKIKETTGLGEVDSEIVTEIVSSITNEEIAKVETGLDKVIEDKTVVQTNLEDSELTSAQKQAFTQALNEGQVKDRIEINFVTAEIKEEADGESGTKNVLKTLTYDITPYAVYTDSEGKEVKVELKGELGKEVKVRIPLTKDFVGVVAVTNSDTGETFFEELKAPTEGEPYLDMTFTHFCVFEFANATPIPEDTTELDGGWYVVNKDTEVSNRITVNGTSDNPTRLYIMDDVCLKTTGGFYVGTDKVFEIYGGEKGTGNLDIQLDDWHCGYTAIGGDPENNDCGTVKVCGGIVYAKAYDDVTVCIGGLGSNPKGRFIITGGRVSTDYAQNGIGVETYEISDDAIIKYYDQSGERFVYRTKDDQNNEKSTEKVDIHVHNFDSEGKCRYCGVMPEKRFLNFQDGSINLTYLVDLKGYADYLGNGKNVSEEFYVSLTQIDIENYSTKDDYDALMIQEDDFDQYYVSDGEFKGYYKFAVEVPAAQITDAIKLKVYSCDMYVEEPSLTKESSVADYCMTIISGTDFEERYVSICKSIIDYGRASMSYFGSNTNWRLEELNTLCERYHYEFNYFNDLENATISEEYKYTPSEASGDMTIVPMSVSLRTLSKTTLRVYYYNVAGKGAVISEGWTVGDDSVKVTPSEGTVSLSLTFSDGTSGTADCGYVDIEGIDANKLDKVYTLQNGGNTVLSYSVLNYVSNLWGKNDLNETNILCRALYSYFEAAFAAFGD